MAKSTASAPPERPVVAELGRPETPEEEAARKRARTIAYRDSKTLKNLLIALGLTVALLLGFMLLVPRPDGVPLYQAVDYQQVAAGAQASMPIPLAAPALPEGWSSNVAEIRSGASDKVVSWYIGLISPSKQYVGVTQALDANPSWLAEQVAKGFASDVVTLDGVQWTVYDNRSTGADVGNAKYALTTESGPTTYVVFGTAGVDDITTVATALGDNVRAQAAVDPATLPSASASPSS
ncbi:DUF4245 domain-containing protein [Herbiconiux sp. 11R-BC]|uniref:DUF4245 domain-containing protein n=1 Tax=Herbiconiux sp. 11R-BC TaxID=3111637 RepID=UPI003C083848